MSNRDDIPNRLIYTCNCGWIDLGHANSRSSRPNIGAQNLWQQIVSRSGTRTRWPFAGYLVEYRQDMTSWRIGTGGRYLVAANLTRQQMESVALGIFLEVSYRFESMQWWLSAGNNVFSSSGYSEEDLISNLLGFYRAVRPGTDYLRLCGPVSADASRAVWDANGGLGTNETTQPIFHPCSECRGTPRFPPQLQQIRPAPKGQRGGNLWRNWQGTGFR